jgi:hypothetical protein
MSIVRTHFFILSLVISFILSLVTDWYIELSIFLFLVTVFANLDKLGKGLLLRELVALYSIFICLLMPSVGYKVYNQDNYLARIFYKYMFVPEEVYFGFALPALCLFALGLCYPIKKEGAVLDEGDSFKKLLLRIRSELKTRIRTGIVIVIIGVLTYFALPAMPDAIKFAVTLLFFSSFAGILYIYYSPPFRSKKLLLVLFSLFILGLAVESGIFTVVAYMGITLFSFLFLGNKMALWKKFAVFVTCCLILIITQSVKEAFRDKTWRGNVVDNKASLFADIFITKISNFDKLMDVDALFPIYTRANQGHNISRVMRRFPSQLPFDDGSHLLITTASALVPRFLWPDKAEAGGVENMKYFAGVTINGWSTNVSPLGEAYASFGPVGGIFYMLLLGLFIRWVYKRVFIISQGLPLLILWLPVLFYQITYSMETDSLQIFNSLLKGSFFLWMLYVITPDWFGVSKKKVTRKRVLLRYHFPE